MTKIVALNRTQFYYLPKATGLQGQMPVPCRNRFVKVSMLWRR